MSERKYADQWDSLVNQLGAAPKLSKPKPKNPEIVSEGPVSTETATEDAPAPEAEESPFAAAAEPAAIVAGQEAPDADETDWGDVCRQLGIDPPPQPSAAPDEEPTPAHRPSTSSGRSSKPKSGPRKLPEGYTSAFGPTPPDLLAIEIDDERAQATEAAAMDAMSDIVADETQTLYESEFLDEAHDAQHEVDDDEDDEENDDDVDELDDSMDVESPGREEEEEPVEEAPRRRPRRRRRRRRGRESEDAEAGEAEAEQDESSDEGQADEEEDDEDEEAASESRGRRRKRRRGRGRSSDDDAPEKAPAPRRGRRAAKESSDGFADGKTQPTGAVANDQPDDEADKKKVAHRSIPSWEEAIGMIVSANVESRAKSTHKSHRGRGRGRRG